MVILPSKIKELIEDVSWDEHQFYLTVEFYETIELIIFRLIKNSSLPNSDTIRCAKMLADRIAEYDPNFSKNLNFKKAIKKAGLNIAINSWSDLLRYVNKSLDKKKNRKLP